MQDSLSNKRVLFNKKFIINQEEALKKAIAIETDKLSLINKVYDEKDKALLKETKNNILNMTLREFFAMWYDSFFNNELENRMFFIGLTLIIISLIIKVVI